MSYRNIGGSEWRDLGTTGQGRSGPAETRGLPTLHSNVMYGRSEHETGFGRRSGYTVWVCFASLHGEDFCLGVTTVYPKHLSSFARGLAWDILEPADIRRRAMLVVQSNRRPPAYKIQQSMLAPLCTGAILSARCPGRRQNSIAAAKLKLTLLAETSQAQEISLFAKERLFM